MDKKIGFIGAGNMATAIINGILTNNYAQPKDLYVFDLDCEKLKLMSQKSINITTSASEIVLVCDIIVLAVKPQNYSEVLNEVKNNATENKIFVSIAAGISTTYITDALGVNCPVVRVMPNTPLLLGKGASALCTTKNISDDDFKVVHDMFALSGVVEILSEDHMNEVIAVNGSSPAYIYLFAKAMCDYAVEQGIDEKSAMNLVCATLEGSAAMLRDSGDEPQTLINKVSSKGGTTIAALDTLEKLKFYDAIKLAMDSCTKRAEELGK